MQYLRNRDFKVVTSFLTRYEMYIISGSFYHEERISWPADQKISFEVDYWGQGDDVPKMTKKQAALAVVIYNDVEIRWYNKSRNRGLGANFETEERSRTEWSEMVKEFLSSHPEFEAKNWYNYLVGSWPDNYDRVDEDEDEE